MGNIKGTKRGAYKKNNLTKSTNEKISIEKINEKNTTTKSRGIKEDIIQKHKSRIDSVKPIEPELATNSNNGNSESANISSGTFEVEPQGQTYTETSGEEKLNSFFAEYEQVITESENINTDEKTTVVEAESPINIGNNFTSSSAKPSLNVLINGYMLLTMMDIVFPIGIKFIFGLFNKEAKKINVNDLKLEPEQRESLRAMADQVAVYIFEKVNPLTMFVLMSAVFYGTNLQSAMQKNKS